MAIIIDVRRPFSSYRVKPHKSNHSDHKIADALVFTNNFGSINILCSVNVLNQGVSVIRIVWRIVRARVVLKRTVASD